MIAVDTSALMAIVLNEPEANACAAALQTDDRLLMSAGTLAELMIVADRRGLADEIDQLVVGLGFEIIDVTPASARRCAEAYRQWGKGHHQAALNFGDCFAYDAAKQSGCPLLYVGHDFALTDIEGASTDGPRHSGPLLNEP